METKHEQLDFGDYEESLMQPDLYLEYAAERLSDGGEENKLDRFLAAPLIAITGTWLRLFEEKRIEYEFNPETGSLPHIVRQIEYLKIRGMNASERKDDYVDAVPADVLNIALRGILIDLEPKK